MRRNAQVDSFISHLLREAQEAKHRAMPLIWYERLGITGLPDFGTFDTIYQPSLLPALVSSTADPTKTPPDFDYFLHK